MTDLDALRARCSRLGFGCASFWAKSLFAERRAIALVHEAIELGISVFDTGPMYSAGEAERRLGLALSGRDRDRLVIMSKVGEARQAGIPKDFSAAAIERSTRESLRRLGVDHLDVLWLHGCPRNEWNDSLRSTLRSIVQRGMVRAVGLNSFEIGDIEASIDEPVFDALMFDINLSRPDNAERAHRAASTGKCVFSAAALARAPWNRRWWQVRSTADVWYWMRAQASRSGGNPGSGLPDGRPGGETRVPSAGESAGGAQGALRWVVAQPGVDCALFNTTRLNHLRENAAVLTPDRSGDASPIQR